MVKSMQSISYYNNNATEFIDRTININVSTSADQFLELIVDKSRILDLGCGSGRDSKYFMERGYDVYAVDGSESLVNYAKDELGINAEVATFESFEGDLVYNGIWAMASLLHVPEIDMVRIVSKYRDMLVDGGIFFMSFKRYKDNFSFGGRLFTCYEADSLRAMVKQVGGLKIIKMTEAPSAKANAKDEYWVSVFCQKTE